MKEYRDRPGMPRPEPDAVAHGYTPALASIDEAVPVKDGLNGADSRWLDHRIAANELVADFGAPQLGCSFLIPRMLRST